MREDMPEKNEHVIIKRDLKNAPRVYVLYESIIKLLYNNLIIEDDTKIPALHLKDFFNTFASEYGQTILLHLWEHGATTVDEISKLYNIGGQTVKNNFDKLERIGIMHPTVKISRSTGGNVSWVFALTVASPEESVAAQLKYDQLIAKTKRVKSQRIIQYSEHRREQTSAMAEEKHNELISLLVTRFTELYEETQNPICLREIDKQLKQNGVNDANLVHKISEELEEQGILTNYTMRNGEPDPTVKPTRKILAIRERRKKNR